MKKKKSLLIDEKPTPIQNVSVTAPIPTNTQPAAAVTPTIYTSRVQKPIIKPKETAADAKQTFQRPGSISISSHAVVASPQASYSENTTEKSVVQNKEFTAEDLTMTWQKFAETIPEQGRMASFFQSTMPNMTSSVSFEITVSNILQEKELLRLQPDILDFIHFQLQNSSIKMTIKIAEESEIQRANTPEDRYKLLAEQNLALDILKNGLQLEID